MFSTIFGYIYKIFSYIHSGKESRAKSKTYYYLIKQETIEKLKHPIYIFFLLLIVLCRNRRRRLSNFKERSLFQIYIFL